MQVAEDFSIAEGFELRDADLILLSTTILCTCGIDYEPERCEDILMKSITSLKTCNRDVIVDRTAQQHQLILSLSTRCR